MEPQSWENLFNVADDAANVSYRIPSAQAADAHAERLRLATVGVHLMEVVYPGGDVDGVAQIVVDMLPLYDRTPAPTCMEVLAQDANGRGRRCRRALSYLGRTGTLTRPIGEDRPLPRPANRPYPGPVLPSAEVEARLEPGPCERVT